MSAIVQYVAVYRSVGTGPADTENDAICVGLFVDIGGALLEAVVPLLEQGYHVSVEHGEMSQAEWDALEEVPDDFETSRSEVRP